MIPTTEVVVNSSPKAVPERIPSAKRVPSGKRLPSAGKKRDPEILAKDNQVRRSRNDGKNVLMDEPVVYKITGDVNPNSAGQSTSSLYKQE